MPAFRASWLRDTAIEVALVSIMVLWNSASSAAQQGGVQHQATAQQKDATRAKDQALVKQFWPSPLLLDRQGARRTPDEDELSFLTADLNGTGEQEFIIAAYGDGDVNREALLVLRKTRGSAVVVDEVGYATNSAHPNRVDFGGSSPELSLIDVDGGGRPAVLLHMGTVRGIGGTLLLKWDGISLVSAP